MTPEEFRQTLKEIGFTQSRLARMLQMKPTTISNMLNGRTRLDRRCVILVRAMSLMPKTRLQALLDEFED